jgi:hypothetical protein
VFDPAIGLLQNRHIVATALGFLALGCAGGASTDMGAFLAVGVGFGVLEWG